LTHPGKGWSFSALQRAENSSIEPQRVDDVAPVQFQCSSASRKFLNSVTLLVVGFAFWSFSALQRAENSSIWDGRRSVPEGRGRFSALQRAENSSIKLRIAVCGYNDGFSALQRAENSSIARNPRPTMMIASCFSALQRAENSSI